MAFGEAVSHLPSHTDEHTPGEIVGDQNVYSSYYSKVPEMENEQSNVSKSL